MATLEIRPQGWKHSVCARSGGAFVQLEVCTTWEDANDVLELGSLDYVPDWLNPPAKAEGGGRPTGSTNSSLTNSEGQHNDH